MKETKVIIVILVTILLIVSLFVVNIINQKQTEFMTAINAREIANNISIEWHDDAILTCVGSMGDKGDIGESSEWYFFYISPSTYIIENNVTRYDTAYIYVFSNKSTVTDTAYRVDNWGMKSINDWFIDSSSAESTALNNKSIASFLQKYQNAQIGGYTLLILEAYPDTPVWIILWHYDEFIDNPHSAEIHIDATTGEVLYVEVDD